MTNQKIVDRITSFGYAINEIVFASRYMRNQERLFIMAGDALISPYPLLTWILEKVKVSWF